MRQLGKNYLIDSPDAPPEQAYSSYKWVANAGEGWESGLAPNPNIQFQHPGAKFQQCNQHRV